MSKLYQAGGQTADRQDNLLIISGSIVLIPRTKTLVSSIWRTSGGQRR